MTRLGICMAAALIFGACIAERNEQGVSRTRKRKYVYEPEVRREPLKPDTAKAVLIAQLDSLLKGQGNAAITPVTEETLDSMGLDSVFYQKYADYNWYAAAMLDPNAKLPFDPNDPDPALDAFIEVSREPRPLNLDKVLGSVVYPESAKNDGVEGKVQVKILINTDGYAKDFYVRRSPDIRLTHALLERCRFLHYHPAMLDGAPVKAWVNISYDFTLNTAKGG
ncbi:MAG: TonB family protein [Bacteroidia bacterium]|nr:energy transducer TonB [Bacteroidia bacterium]MDW8333961.1 TonB family protein [Bacteroidia bacterium]